MAAAASMGHPYAPAELDLPGFVPLKLSQVEILVSYLGASVFVFLAVWLVSGTTTLFMYMYQYSTCSSVSSSRTPVLLRIDFQIPTSEVGILPTALVGFTGIDRGIGVGEGETRDVQQDPRLEGLGATSNFKLITLSVS
jgi:hypothetical protein